MPASRRRRRAQPALCHVGAARVPPHLPSLPPRASTAALAASWAPAAASSTIAPAFTTATVHAFAVRSAVASAAPPACVQL